MSNNIPKINQLQNPSQFNNQNQPNQPNQPNGPINPLANYTLPGVINYLTNEFTNLERFKIMNNLEKSEMKYKITQLQGELNSLKYSNEEQKLTISRLKKENAELRKQLGQEVKEVKKEEDKLLEIPQVDLQVIKDSRFQLTKSMREVIHLLRSPVNANLEYLEIPDGNDTNHSFDELFSKEKSEFNFHNKEPEDKGISKYFQSSTENLNEDFQNLNIEPHVEPSLESDSETVVLDGNNELEVTLPEPNLKQVSINKTEIEVKEARVFNNKFNDILTIFETTDDGKTYIELFDTQTNTEIVKFLSTKGDLDEDNIIDIYCIDYETDLQVAKLIIVTKTEVCQFVLDKDDPLNTIIIKDEIMGEIMTSGLIDFSEKSNEFSKHFGLSLTIEDINPKVMVFELNTGLRNDLKASIIGEFTRNYFKNLISNSTSNFEIIKWFKSQVSNHSSPKKKTHKNTDTNPYTLVIKYEHTIMTLNIFSKHYEIVTNYSSNLTFDLENNNHFLLLTNKSPDAHQLLIYDLSNSIDPSIIDIDSDDKALYTTFTNGSLSCIAAISDNSIKLYDLDFKFLEESPITPNPIFRVGNSIIIEDSSLHLYKII